MVVMGCGANARIHIVETQIDASSSPRVEGFDQKSPSGNPDIETISDQVSPAGKCDEDLRGAEAPVDTYGIRHTEKFGKACEDSVVYVEETGNGRRESHSLLPIQPASSEKTVPNSVPALIPNPKEFALSLQAAFDALPSASLDLRLPDPAPTLPSQDPQPVSPSKAQLMDELIQDLESV